MSHLVPVDDALVEFHCDGAYIALCGQVLGAASLPPWECPPGCDCDLRLYCPQCIRRAAEYAAPVGSEAGAAPVPFAVVDPTGSSAGHQSGAAPLAPPSGQPDPTASSPALCWARDPDDGRLHATARSDVDQAAARGYTECLCGHKLPVDVGLEDGPSGALCLPCVVGVTADVDPGRFGGWAI